MLVFDNKLKYTWVMVLVLAVGGGVPLLWRAMDNVMVPLQLPSLTGTQVYIPDQRGRLTWVNSWSATCASCLRELPALEALHRDYAAQVQVVAVAMPYDPPNTVEEVRQRQSVQLPLLLDLEGKAAQHFAPDMVVPAHHLLDANGRVLQQVQGEMTLAAMQAMLIPHLPPRP